MSWLTKTLVLKRTTGKCQAEIILVQINKYEHTSSFFCLSLKIFVQDLIEILDLEKRRKEGLEKRMLNFVLKIWIPVSRAMG